MTIGELVNQLKDLPQDTNILLASDYDWNHIYPEFILDKSADEGDYIIYPTGEPLESNK